MRIANSSGREVVAHASTPEGMRRAVRAGVATMEHGDGGDAEVFALMRENGVAICPTLAAADAILQYGGWRKGVDAEPERIQRKRASFHAALESGVDLCFGGDVGAVTDDPSNDISALRDVRLVMKGGEIIVHR